MQREEKEHLSAYTNSPPPSGVRLGGGKSAASGEELAGFPLPSPPPPGELTQWQTNHELFQKL